MLSRIADSLFWMNRYMERTDGLLRSLTIGYIASFDVDKQVPFSWQPILQVFSNQTEKTSKLLANNANEVLRIMTNNLEEHNSIKVMVTRARENARGAQDHITKEVWESINQLYHHINNVNINTTIEQGNQVNMLTQLIESTLLFNGVTDTTMPRGNGWNYMCLGRHTERCFQTLKMIDAKFESMDYNMDDAQDILYWKNLLLSLGGYELYLKTYRTGNHTENILHMGFFNTQFPKSIQYSIKRVGHYLQQVLNENQNENKEIIEKKYGRLFSTVAFSDLGQVKTIGLKEYILSIQTQLFELNTLLGQSFFSYY